MSLNTEDFPSKTLERFRKERSFVVFPIDFQTVDGGKFLGDILTDGYILTNGTVGYSNSNPLLISQNIQSTAKLFTKKSLQVDELFSRIANHKKENLDRLSKEISSFINLHCKIRYKEDRNCYIVSYSTALSKILEKIDIQRGKRILTNPSLPKVVESASKAVICAFLKRVIANEAAVTNDGQVCIRQAVLSHDSPKLLKGYRKLFKKLGIKTTSPRISKKYKGKHGVHIVYEIYTRPYDLIKIVRKIGIRPYDKLQKAKDFLKNVKRFRLTMDERFQQIILIAKKFQRSFTVNDITTSVDLKRSAVQDYLYGLMEMGFLARNQNREFYPNGSEPFYYQLTKKGEKFVED